MTRYDTPTNWTPATERRLSIRLIYWPMWEKVPWWNIRLSRSRRFLMFGPYELRIECDHYQHSEPNMNTPQKINITESPPEFQIIEDIANDWLQANPLAQPRLRETNIAGVTVGNSDLGRLREYVEASIPDNADVTGAMIQVVLSRVVAEHQRQIASMSWLRRPAKWWQIWRPQSGFAGGMIYGAILCGIVWALVKFVPIFLSQL